MSRPRPLSPSEEQRDKKKQNNRHLPSSHHLTSSSPTESALPHQQRFDGPPRLQTLTNVSGQNSDKPYPSVGQIGSATSSTTFFTARPLAPRAVPSFASTPSFSNSFSHNPVPASEPPVPTNGTNHQFQDQQAAGHPSTQPGQLQLPPLTAGYDPIDRLSSPTSVSRFIIGPRGASPRRSPGSDVSTTVDNLDREHRAHEATLDLPGLIHGIQNDPNNNLPSFLRPDHLSRGMSLPRRVGLMLYTSGEAALASNATNLTHDNGNALASTLNPRGRTTTTTTTTTTANNNNNNNNDNDNDNDNDNGNNDNGNNDNIDAPQQESTEVGFLSVDPPTARASSLTPTHDPDDNIFDTIHDNPEWECKDILPKYHLPGTEAQETSVTSPVGRATVVRGLAALLPQFEAYVTQGITILSVAEVMTLLNGVNLINNQTSGGQATICLRGRVKLSTLRAALDFVFGWREETDSAFLPYVLRSMVHKQRRSSKTQQRLKQKSGKTE